MKITNYILYKIFQLLIIVTRILVTKFTDGGVNGTIDKIAINMDMHVNEWKGSGKWL